MSEICLRCTLYYVSSGVSVDYFRFYSFVLAAVLSGVTEACKGRISVFVGGIIGVSLHCHPSGFNVPQNV